MTTLKGKSHPLILFQVILNWCCDSELKQVKVVPVLNHILLDWRIWHKAPQGVWEKLLCHLEQLLVTPSNGIVSQSSVNWHSFLESNAIGKLLLTSKVCSHCLRTPYQLDLSP